MRTAGKFVGCDKGRLRHCHGNNFKNSTAQKHVYTIGNLLTVQVFLKLLSTSVLKLNIECVTVITLGAFDRNLKKSP